MKSYFPPFIKFVTLTTAWKADIHREINPDGTVIYTREAKYMRYLSEALNFRFHIEYSKDGTIGRDLGDGNWTGIIGMIQRGESDLGLTMLGITEDRMRAVNFSYPYYLADSTFLTHKPEVQPKSFAIFYPFSYTVWISLLASLLVVSLLFLLDQKKASYLHLLISTFGNIFQQFSNRPFRSYGVKVLHSTWAAGVMILSMSYSAILLSYLSFPPLRGVRTIAELSGAVAGGSYVCVTFKNNHVISDFLYSDDEAIRVIGRSLAKNSMSYSNADAVLAQSQIKAAFVASRPYLTSYQRNFYLSRDSFGLKVFAVAIRPGFCCKSALERAIRKIFESGLYEKIFSDRDFKAFIKEKDNDVDANHAITLDDTLGVYIILVMGHLLAILSFVLEIFSKRLQKTTA